MTIHPEHIIHIKEEFEFRIKQARDPNFFIIRDTLLAEIRGFISALTRVPLPAGLYEEFYDKYNQLRNELKARENEISDAKS